MSKVIGKVRPTLEGKWSNDRDYEQLCIVEHLGNSYISVRDVPSGTEPDPDSYVYWQLLARQGKPPKHEVQDGKLRFQLPDGEWSDWLDVGEELSGYLQGLKNETLEQIESLKNSYETNLYEIRVDAEDCANRAGYYYGEIKNIVSDNDKHSENYIAGKQVGSTFPAIKYIVKCTQTEYDEIEEPDEETLYVVVDDRQ